MKNYLNIMTGLFAVLLFTGCKKDEFNFQSQSHPAIPVTITNPYGVYSGLPTVSTTLASGTITITLAIPAASGRTIKEISRVAVSTSLSNYRLVQGTTGLYNSAPVGGSGQLVSFTTSLSEYKSKTGLPVPTSSTAGTTKGFLDGNFYFLVTLDNGDQLLPVPVRVYVIN